MSQLRYRDAIWGDAISYLGTGRAGWTARLARDEAALPQRLSPSMALTSALAAVRCNGCRSGHGRLASGKDVVQRARDCWDLGRWTALSNLASVDQHPGGAMDPGRFPRSHRGRQAPGAWARFWALRHPALFSIGNLIVPATAQRAALGGGRRGDAAWRWHLRRDRRPAGHPVLPAAERSSRCLALRGSFMAAVIPLSLTLETPAAIFRGGIPVISYFVHGAKLRCSTEWRAADRH